MEAYQRAQGEVGSALSRLLAVTENYPELKANENFQTLQAQLEGTENRISVERRNFNDVARAYNASIRRFPKNIFAGMFGFEKRPYFEAQEGAEKAPEVKFWQEWEESYRSPCWFVSLPRYGLSRMPIR